MQVRADARQVIAQSFDVETSRPSQNRDGSHRFSTMANVVPVISAVQFKDILAGLVNITATLSFVFGNKQQSAGLCSSNPQALGRRNIFLRAAQSFKIPRFSVKKTSFRVRKFFIWHIVYFIVGWGNLLARACSNTQSYRSGLAGLASGDWNEPVTIGSRADYQLDRPAKQDYSSKEVNHVPWG